MTEMGRLPTGRTGVACGLATFGERREEADVTASAPLLLQLRGVVRIQRGIAKVHQISVWLAQAGSRCINEPPHPVHPHSLELS